MMCPKLRSLTLALADLENWICRAGYASFGGCSFWNQWLYYEMDWTCIITFSNLSLPLGTDLLHLGTLVDVHNCLREMEVSTGHGLEQISVDCIETLLLDTGWLAIAVRAVAPREIKVA